MTNTPMTPAPNHDGYASLKALVTRLWQGLKHLVAEGNKRQLQLRNKQGATLLSLPLTLAALLALVALWAGLFALLAVAAVIGLVLGAQFVVVKDSAQPLS
jgi:hypothetical protein